MNHPIEKVLSRLWDHEVFRTPMTTGVEIEKQEPGAYLARHRTNLLTKILFIKLAWMEDWAFALAEGTPEAPDKIVLSFQKIEGTAHISRLCYNMVLRRTPQGTDVSQYQEGRITARTSLAMLGFLQLVLSRLRTAELHCSNGTCSGDDLAVNENNRDILPQSRNLRTSGASP